MSTFLIPVLVAPQMGENIGAVARAMGNFGLSELRIVNPRDGWPNPAAEAMAAHAQPVIQNAKLYDTLAEAVADCEYVVAATARQRDMAKPHYSPKQWLQSPMAKDTRTALLFGRENNGLSNEEIALAQAIITIPVSPQCPSINLAQSAAVLCYEWYQAQLSHTPSEGDHHLPSPAPQAQLQQLFHLLEQRLDATNFWRVAAKKEKMWQNLRGFFLRAQPSSQEVQSLMGAVKSISGKTAGPEDKS